MYPRNNASPPTVAVGSIYKFPCSFANRVANGCCCYVKTISQRLIRFAGLTKLSNEPNRVFRKLAAWMPAPKGMPFLLSHIIDIVCLRAFAEMGRVDTSWIVACMQNIPVGWSAFVNFPTNDMSPIRRLTALTCEFTVSKRITCSLPIPTSRWIVPVARQYVFPESIRNRKTGGTQAKAFPRAKSPCSILATLRKFKDATASRTCELHLFFRCHTLARCRAIASTSIFQSSRGDCKMYSTLLALAI